MMRRLLVALAVAMSFPPSASAAASASMSQMSCSGSLSSSLLDAASFSCAGSFSLSGGEIFSESRVEISANGSLWLDNLSITAPFVQLVSLDGGLAIGPGVVIRAGSLILDSGDWESLAHATNRTELIVSSGRPDLDPIRPAGSIDGVTRGDVTILPGGAISLASPVPEPDTFTAMLLGLLVVLSLAKGRRSAAPPAATRF